MAQSATWTSGWSWRVRMCPHRDPLTPVQSPRVQEWTMDHRRAISNHARSGGSAPRAATSCLALRSIILQPCPPGPSRATTSTEAVERMNEFCYCEEMGVVVTKQGNTLIRLIYEQRFKYPGQIRDHCKYVQVVRFSFIAASISPHF